MITLWSWLRRLPINVLPGHGGPRVLRRVTVRCPETGGDARIDVVEDSDPQRRVVQRCSLHDECPPSCDRACAAQAGAAPVVAQLIFPAGSSCPEDQD